MFEIPQSEAGAIRPDRNYYIRECRKSAPNTWEVAVPFGATSARVLVNVTESHARTDGFEDIEGTFSYGGRAFDCKGALHPSQTGMLLIFEHEDKP